MEKLSIFNWVDIVVFFLFARVIFIALRRSIVVESLKFCGVFLALFFSFQYYPKISTFLNTRASFIGQPQGKFVSFLLIFALVLFLFALLEKLFSSLLKIELHQAVGKWLLLFLGISRGVLLVSALFFASWLFYGKKYFTKRGVSQRYLSSPAPYIYKVSYTVYAKFFPHAKFNKEVEKYNEAGKNLPPSNKRGNKS